MSKSIGIKLADGSFYPILEEGVPDKKRLELTTVKDNQETVQVDLYRTETGSMDDAEYVDSLQIENIAAHPNGEPTLAFNIALDENNNLSADICDPESGEKSDISIKLVNRDENERASVPNFDLTQDFIDDSSALNEPVSTEEIAIDDTADISAEDNADDNLSAEPIASGESEVVSSDEAPQEKKHSGGLLAAAAALGAAGGVAAAAANTEKTTEPEPTANIADDTDLPDFDLPPLEKENNESSNDFSDSSLDNFDLPPMGSESLDISMEANEQTENSDDTFEDISAIAASGEDSTGIAAENNTNSADSFDLPPLENNESSAGDFDLPPIENDTISDEMEVPSADALDSADTFAPLDSSTDNFDLPPLEENSSEETVVNETPSTDFSAAETTESPDVTETAPLEMEESTLPDIDFDETVPLNEPIPDNSEPLADTSTASDNDNLFDLPDFDTIDSNTQSTDTDLTSTAAASTFAPADSQNSTSSSDLNFNDLYDEETLDGSSTESAVKKTKRNVIICTICAIICIIMTLLILFVIPSKLNIAKSKPAGKTNKDDVIVLSPKPVEQDENKSVESVKEPVKEEKKVEVSPAKENEVVVAPPAANVVPKAPAAPKTKKEDIRYKIRWGDTLWDISEAYYKTPWKYPKIAKYNKIRNPDRIISGTTIIIPAE